MIIKYKKILLRVLILKSIQPGVIERIDYGGSINTIYMTNYIWIAINILYNTIILTRGNIN